MEASKENLAPQPSKGKMATYQDLLAFIESYVPIPNAMTALKFDFNRHQGESRPYGMQRGVVETHHEPPRQGGRPPHGGRGSDRTMISRQRMSDEDLIKMRAIRENADHWLASKKEDDETVKLYRHLKQTLNKLSPDNFELITAEILKHCEKEDFVDVIISFLVTKAWNEPVYTRWYAELAERMIKHPMQWDMSAKSTGVKEKILWHVEVKYTEGFDDYHRQKSKIVEDASLTREDKDERLGKMRKALLGNINFICELFHFQIVSSTTIRWSVFYGLGKFLKEYLASEGEGAQFSLKEDYLEALLKLFENSGQLLEQRAQKRNTGSKAIDQALIERLGRILQGRDRDVQEFFEFANERIRMIRSLVDIFFNFLRLLRAEKQRPVSLRMESLIDNLNEFRSSGWKVRVKRIEAAKYSKEGKQRAIEQRQAAQAAQAMQAAQVRVETWADESVSVAKAPKVTHEELTASVKTINVAVRAGVDEDALMELYEKHFFQTDSPALAFQVWLENIATDIRQTAALEPRYKVGLRFVTEKLISREEFYSILYKTFPHFAMIYCDQAYLLGALAEFLHRLRATEAIDLRQLRLENQHKDVTNPDDAEEFGLFMDALVEKIVQVFSEKPDGQRYEEEILAIKRGGKS